MAYVEINLDHGTAIIEIEDRPGAQPISVLAESAGRALGAVESSLASIQELATRITRHLGAAIPDGPDEIELTFGIKASAEVNALVIAKAQGEANYTVRLKWIRPKVPAQDA
jgi:hypothetical protein